MIYGSVCSGIEAATQAWAPLGWAPAFFSEIEKFPSEILGYHYPDVPLHGDFTTIKENEYGQIDLLVGGTPCQSFSVAGLRQGMRDPRGNLALGFIGMVDRERPRWVVWENVPGVLSSHGGRDFGAFLGALAKLGYGFAYRVLDAQYFGLAQRRKRVFVVAHSGGAAGPAAVLFDAESMRGNPAPSREAEQNLAGTLEASAGRSRGAGQSPGMLVAETLQATSNDYSRTDTYNYVLHGTQDPDLNYDQAHPLGRNQGQENTVFVFQPRFARNDRGGPSEVAYPLTAQAGTSGRGDSANVVFSFKPSHYTRGKDGAPNAVCPPLSADADKGDQDPVIFVQNSRSEVREMPYAGALAARHGVQQQNYVRDQLAVRRLTPIECERLMGFPDDYTRIAWRGKSADHCPDGPRYRALGNSMAVPVVAWLGARIEYVDRLQKIIG